MSDQATAAPPRARLASTLYDALEKRGDERALAIESMVEAQSRAMDWHRQTWIETQGMIYGDQWGKYDAGARTWASRAPAPSAKITRLSLNHMAPLISTAVSLHCAEALNLRCAAGGSELSDLEKSAGADAILQHYMMREQLDELEQDQVETCLGIGNAFVHVYWDGDAGDLVRSTEPTPQDAPPTFDEEGNVLPPAPPAAAPEGDLRVEIVSAYRVNWDPAATASNPGMWCSIDTEISLAEFQGHPGVPQELKDRVSSEIPVARDGMDFEQRVSAMFPRGVDNGDYSGQLVRWWSRESVIIRRTYIAATPDYPNGLDIVSCQGGLIYEGDNPAYRQMDPETGRQRRPRWPFRLHHFWERRPPGGFWAQGSGTLMVPPQKALNGTASKKLTIIRKIAHATLVKPKGVNFQKSDQVDQEIEVPTTLQPGSVYYLQSPNFPQELSGAEAMYVEEMADKIGIGPASQGLAPESGTAASLWRQNLNREIGRRSIIKRRWRRQWARVAMAMLEEIQAHVTTERTIELVGENKRTQVIEFTGAMLDGIVDVTCSDDQQRPLDPAQRQVWAQNLVQMGLVDVNDPEQRAELCEAVGFGSWQRYEEDMRTDRAKQRRENLALYRGETVAVEWWEKDEDHLAILTSEMNTQSWTTATTPLPTDPPEMQQRKAQIRATFIAHMEAHLQNKDEKAGVSTLPGPGGAPEPVQAGAGQAPEMEAAAA